MSGPIEWLFEAGEFKHGSGRVGARSLMRMSQCSRELLLASGVAIASPIGSGSATNCHWRSLGPAHLALARALICARLATRLT